MSQHYGTRDSLDSKIQQVHTLQFQWYYTCSLTRPCSAASIFIQRAPDFFPGVQVRPNCPSDGVHLTKHAKHGKFCWTKWRYWWANYRNYGKKLWTSTINGGYSWNIIEMNGEFPASHDWLPENSIRADRKKSMFTNHLAVLSIWNTIKPQKKHGKRHFSFLTKV